MRPSRKKIAGVINDQIKRGVSPKVLSKKLAAYLLSENRSRELSSLMRDCLVLRADDGHIEALSTSARALGASGKADVIKLIKSIRPEASSVLLNEQLDESLIGGLKLTVVNERLDLSVRSKLNRLKQLSIKRSI